MLDTLLIIEISDMDIKQKFCINSESDMLC